MFGLKRRSEPPVLHGEGFVIRLPVRADFDQWFALRLHSRPHLEPFEPKWPERAPTPRTFARRVRRARQLAGEGREYSMLIFLHAQDSGQLAGGITLSNIQYNAARHANLGYWLGAPFVGQGIMRRAVGRMLTFAFADLALWRVHAACLPHNNRSISVLEHNGFAREGFAEDYLQINGRLADHVLFGLTRKQFRLNGGKVPANRLDGPDSV